MDNVRRFRCVWEGQVGKLARNKSEAYFSMICCLRISAKPSNSSPIEIIGEQSQNLIERSAKMWKVDTLYYNLPIFL